MRSPLSTPAGTLTASVFFLRTRPCPKHGSQGCEMILPRPLQRGHVCCTANGPWRICTCPCPAHVSHVVVFDPGAPPVPLHFSHSPNVVNSTLTESPNTACSRLSSR